jgi:hypothetical protein
MRAPVASFYAKRVCYGLSIDVDYDGKLSMELSKHLANNAVERGNVRRRPRRDLGDTGESPALRYPVFA